MRLRRRVLPLATSAQPPWFFRLCSVDIGTRKISPYHIYHVNVVVNCCVHTMGAGYIWALYKIFGSRHACTYCTRWTMHNSLAEAFFACRLIFPMMCVQLSFKMAPNILTCEWNSVPRSVTGALHPHIASALDFFGFRHAPDARS
jgi:hypothetical protein